MNLIEKWFVDHPDDLTKKPDEILADMDRVVTPAVTAWGSITGDSPLPTLQDIADVLAVFDGRSYVQEFLTSVVEPLIQSGANRDQIKATVLAALKDG